MLTAACIFAFCLSTDYNVMVQAGPNIMKTELYQFENDMPCRRIAAETNAHLGQPQFNNQTGEWVTFRRATCYSNF